MTTRERFIRTLLGQDVDRVPFMKVFGGDNAGLPEWEEKHPNYGKYLDELLGFEGGYRGWQITPVNFGLAGDIQSKIIAEDEGSYKIQYNYGAVVLQRKHGDFHTHTTKFAVENENDWDFIKERFLNPYEPSRIPKDFDMFIELYKGRDFPLQLTCGGVYGFIRNLMGDEALCYAFYDTPDLVHDIIGTYIDMNIKLWEELCRNVQFDLIECWEDIAGKTGCIISPDTFETFLAPHFRKIRAFADAHHIPLVLVDSDGYVDKLAHQMAACGVNAMYPFEVGAGCQVSKVLQAIPNIGAIGCLEKNSCALGKDAIDEQMEIARNLIRGGRCIPGPDHMVLNNVPFENYLYFMRCLKDIIFHTKPGQ